MARLIAEFDGRLARTQAQRLRRELRKLGIESKVVGGRFADTDRRSRTAGQGLASLRRNVLGAAAGYLTFQAAIRGVEKSLTFATGFDQSLTRISTLVGVNRQQVDAWGADLRDLAIDVGRAPQALSEALFVVTSAGERTSESIRIVAKAGKASAVGLGDTAAVARTVTAAIQAYGKEQLDAARATDILVATVREGNLEASQLGPTLGRVVGIAARVGVTFGQVGGFVATFTRLGVDAEESVTALRALLLQVVNPGAEAVDTLAEVGLSFEELRQSIRDRGLATTLVELVQVFEGNDQALARIIPNARALAGVLGTAGSQAEQFRQIEQNVIESTGILNEAFAETRDRPAHTFAQLNASGTLLAQTLGEDLLPAVQEVSRSLTSLAANPEVRRFFGDVGKFLGGVIRFVGARGLVEIQEEALRTVTNLEDVRAAVGDLRAELINAGELRSETLKVTGGEGPISVSAIQAAEAALESLFDANRELIEQVQQARQESEERGVPFVAERDVPHLRSEIAANDARIKQLDSLIRLAKTHKIVQRSSSEAAGGAADAAGRLANANDGLSQSATAAIDSLKKQREALLAEKTALMQGGEALDLFREASERNISPTALLSSEVKTLVHELRELEKETSQIGLTRAQEIASGVQAPKLDVSLPPLRELGAGDFRDELQELINLTITEEDRIEALRQRTLAFWNVFLGADEAQNILDILRQRMEGLEKQTGRSTERMSDAFEGFGKVIGQELGAAFAAIIRGSQDAEEAIGSMLRSLGSAAGQQAGLALSGGNPIAGQFGAILGGLAGDLLGDLFGGSRPFFSLNLALRQGSLAVGDIRRNKREAEEVRQLGEQLVDQINATFRELGGSLEGLGDAGNLSLFSQEGKVEVRLHGRTFRRFGERIEEALDFFVLEVIRRADVEGLSEPVLGAIRQAATEAEGSLQGFGSDLNLIREIEGLNEGAGQAARAIREQLTNTERLTDAATHFGLSASGALRELGQSLQEIRGSFLDRSGSLGRGGERPSLQRELNETITSFADLREEVKAHNAEIELQIAQKQAELAITQSEIEITRARIQAQEALAASGVQMIETFGVLAEAMDPEIGGRFREIQLPQVDFSPQLDALERTATSLEEVIRLLDEATVPLGELGQDQRQAIQGVRDQFLGQVEGFLGQFDPAAGIRDTLSTIDTLGSGLETLRDRGLLTAEAFEELDKSLANAEQQARGERIREFTDRAADFLGDNRFVGDIVDGRRTSEELRREFRALLEAGLLDPSVFAGLDARLSGRVGAIEREAITDFTRRAAGFLGDAGPLIKSIEGAQDEAGELVAELDSLRAAGVIAEEAFAGVRKRLLAAGEAAAETQIGAAADQLLLGVLERVGREEEAAELRFRLAVSELQIKREELAVAILRFELEGAALERVKDTLARIDAVLPELDISQFGGGGVGTGSLAAPSPGFSPRDIGAEQARNSRGLLDEIERLRNQGSEPSDELARINAEFDDLRDRAGRSAFSLSRLGTSFREVIGDIEALRKERISDFFQDLFDPIRDFRESLLAGESSPLAPRERLGRSEDRFFDTVQDILAGDLSQVGDVRGLGDDLVRQLRDVFPRGSAGFDAGFTRVVDALDQLSDLGRLGEQGQLDPLLEETRSMRFEQTDLMRQVVSRLTGSNQILALIMTQLRNNPLNRVA